MQKLLHPLLIAGGLLLQGCTTVTPADCDPRNANAGFLTKFSCNNQGVYAQRVAHKQQVLVDEQQTNQQFRAVYTAIQQEQAAVRGELGQQRSEYAGLNRALNALLANLKSRSRGNQRIQGQIAAIENDLKTLNQDNRAAVMQKQYELQRLQSRVADLEGDLGLR